MSARSVSLVVAALSWAALSCEGTPKVQAGGVDESQFAEDPALLADLGQAIVVHLETLDGGVMAEDTLTPGIDAIPYKVAFTPEQLGSVEFCFDYPMPHRLDVQNADGKVVVSVTAGEGCSTHVLEDGNYVFRFTHAPDVPGVPLSVSELFVQGSIPISRPSRRVSITGSCDSCWLTATNLQNADFGSSGAGLVGVDFTGADVSGTHFFGASLVAAHFSETMMTGTRLAGTGAELTAALVLKTWELPEAATVFSFALQYPFDLKLPTIAVGITAEGSTIWSTTHALTSDAPLAVDVKTESGDLIQGTLSVVDLPTPFFDNDRAIWGEFRYTTLGVERRFEGVMRTFHSKGLYSAPSSSTATPPLQDATLTFINDSAATEPPDVVLFTQARDPEAGAPIAWRVISPRPSEPTVVDVPEAVDAEATLPSGDPSERLPAKEGELFGVSSASGTDALGALGNSTNPNLIQVINGLAEGSVTANIYRSDRLLFSAPSLGPSDKASFPASTYLSAAVMSDVKEGQVLTEAMLLVPTSRFDLLGVSSADVVMTGSGSTEDPFVFSFANVKYR